MLNRYIDWIFEHHKLIVVCMALAFIVLGSRAGSLKVNHDLQIFFSENSEHLAPFLEMEREYGADDHIYFLIIPGGENVFTLDALRTIDEVTGAIQVIPYAAGVTSITLNPLYPELQKLLDYSGPTPLPQGSPEFGKLESLRNAMLNDRLLTPRIIAPDSSATKIFLGLYLPDESEEAKREVIDRARQLAAGFSAKYPETRFLVGGATAGSVGLIEAVDADLKRITPIAFLLIVITLLLTTRSTYATLATVIVMGFSVTMTMGLFGWLNLELSPVSGFIPTAIITIAVADSIHLLISYKQEILNGREKLDALRNAIHLNLKPVFYTSVTSIAGMLSLNFSDSPPYRELGNMIAVGVFIAYCMSMLLWPALMAWLPKPRSREEKLITGMVTCLGEFVIRRRGLILVSAGILTLTLGSQISQNELTDRWYEYLDEGFESRIAIDETDRRFGGLHHVFYSLESGRPLGVHSPAYVRDVEKFADWYRQQADVSYVVGISDYLEYRKKMHSLGIQAEPEQAGDSAGSNETGKLLNIDLSATRFEVVFNKLDSAKLRTADAPATEWLQKNQTAFETSGATGIDIVFARVNYESIQSVLKGGAIALVLVSFILVLLLKSWSLGLLSLVPNLIPISMAYGLWGFLVGEISLAVAIVMCISLGLVVDDTVHFLCKYSMRRKVFSETPAQAIRYSFRTVGVAIVITSMVLIMGFTSTILSHMLPSRETATLLAITIFFALLADLLILAPLLLLLERRKYSPAE